MLILAACSDSGYVESSSATPSVASFGSADVSPSVVKTGDVVVVTPAAEVQPLCLELAIVHRVSELGLERAGVLSADGGWQDYRTGPTPTFPACAPARNAAPASYVVPPEMREGSYVLCVTQDPEDAGCGGVVVESVA